MKTKLLFLAMFLPFFIYAQQNPCNIKWMEINSKHTKIVFEKGLEKQATKSANLIDYLYEFETKTLKGKPKKLPILLYNQSTISNGFVGLRPYRSAWFITPSQYAADLGTEDWFYTLGSHEFRHAVQYSKSNKYFTKFLSILLGQTGTLIGQYSYPYWFFEGDAVATETALTESGRGRIPQFNMGIRTILQNNKRISYDKAKLGSYKTFYPNHYKLGWILTSYARTKYGADIFDKTIESSSKFSFWPFAFSMALKHHTGLNERKLYKEAMHYYDSIWTTQYEKNTFTDAKILNNTKKKSWTKYTEPNYIENNHILVKKSSMKSDLTSFYILDKNGKEDKLLATDAGIISTAKGKVVWARTYPDLRFQLKDYSDIVCFDYRTKEEKRLTKKQKFFAPALSPDGKKIATVEYTTEMKSALVILNSDTGNEIKRFPATNNDFFRTPSWDVDNQRVVFTKSNETGTVLTIINVENDKILDITKRSAENIGRPVFYKNYIIFNSNLSGIGNIYAINIKTKDKYKITSRKFGAYNPKVKDNKMMFIDYSIDGYDIAEIELTEKEWKPISTVKKSKNYIAKKLQKQEQSKNILTPNLIPQKEFEVTKYKKYKHAINIHSWGLSLNYPDEVTAYKPEVGIEIFSANILNTVFGKAGATYNINEGTVNSNITAIFKRFYPEFSITGGWAQRHLNYKLYDVANNKFVYVPDDWEEMYSKLGVSIPLNFSKGIYTKGATLKTSYSFIQRTNKTLRSITESASGNFSTLSYSGSLYSFRKQATQDINPRLGYFIYGIYQHTPQNKNIFGSQISAIASVYIPGFFKHHSINVKAGYEQQRSDKDFNKNNYYWFSSPQSFPRGHIYYAFNKLSSVSINYSLPLWHPDINIGPFVYFKRIRANMFFDYVSINHLGNDKTEGFSSVGLEMFFQVNLLRLGEPVELGGRVSYLPDGSIVPEFIMFSIPF